VFDAAWVSLRTTDNSLQRLHQFYERWPFGDLCHVVARWLLVATTEIHYKTCFCAVCQDLRPPFFQDFFFSPPYYSTNKSHKLMTVAAIVLWRLNTTMLRSQVDNKN